MWILVVIIVIALFFANRMKSIDTYHPTDEELIVDIVNKVQKTRPGLEPISTVSRDGNTARMLFFNTDTYAGELCDASVSPMDVKVSLVNEKKIPFKL
jgi:hypothetical protein